MLAAGRAGNHCWCLLTADPESTYAFRLSQKPESMTELFSFANFRCSMHAMPRPSVLASKLPYTRYSSAVDLAIRPIHGRNRYATLKRENKRRIAKRLPITPIAAGFSFRVAIAMPRIIRWGNTMVSSPVKRPLFLLFQNHFVVMLYSTVSSDSRSTRSSFILYSLKRIYPHVLFI